MIANLSGGCLKETSQIHRLGTAPTQKHLDYTYIIIYSS